MNSLLISSLLTLLMPLTWRAEGRAEAERDIAAGSMKLKMYGYMAGLRPIDKIARPLFQKRFGLEMQTVAFCVVSDELVGRTDGYNDRIREEVEATHGADAIHRVWVEADREPKQFLTTDDWIIAITSLLFAVAAIAVWRLRRRKRRASVSIGNSGGFQ